MSMLRSYVLAAVAVGLSALLPAIAMAAPAVPAGAKDCRGFRAVGSGLTESIASLMATQGAINLAENRGFSIIGDAKLQSCTSTGIFGVECAATSYACKLPH
jgi:hypothetical protein